ncbi:hypothetical protein [Collimonas sp. OK307]|nr:hypothetical protein [Collimonas sp. OK307]
MISPETEQWFADPRKPQQTITLQASHASMASHPDEIVVLIEDAANATA